MKVNEGELMATFCGSPHYASPEIMKERRYIGPVSFVFIFFVF